MKRIVGFFMAMVLTMMMFAGCGENRQTVEAAISQELESTDVSEQSLTETISIVFLVAKDVIPLEPDWTNLDKALLTHENNPCIDEYESFDSFWKAKLYKNKDGDEVSITVYLNSGLFTRREKGEEQIFYFDTLKLPYEHSVIAYIPTTQDTWAGKGKRDETSFTIVQISGTNEIVCVRDSREIGKHTILKNELEITTLIESIYLLGDTALYMYPYIVHDEKDGTFFGIWTEKGAKRWPNYYGKNFIDYHGIYSGYCKDIYDVEREKFIPGFRTEFWKTFVIETNDKTEKTICMRISECDPDWSWDIELPYIEDETNLEKIELEAKEMEEFIIFPRNHKIKCITRNSGKYEIVFTIGNETAAKNLEHLLEEKQFMQENIQDFDKQRGCLKSIKVKEAYVFSNYEEMVEFMKYLNE